MASPSGTGPPSKRVSPPRGQLGNRSPDEWNAFLDQPGVREVLCQVKVPTRFLPFSFESSMAQEDFAKEAAWLVAVEALLDQGWTAPISVLNPAYELFYRVRLGDVCGFKISPENCMSPMARSSLAYYFWQTYNAVFMEEYESTLIPPSNLVEDSRHWLHTGAPAMLGQGPTPAVRPVFSVVCTGSGIVHLKTP